MNIRETVGVLANIRLRGLKCVRSVARDRLESLRLPIPSPHSTRLRCLSRKFRSADNDPSTSRRTASSTRTVEEPAREHNNSLASTRHVTPPAGQPSADTVDFHIPGDFSSPLPPSSPPMTHCLHRQAVQEGHAQPCVECGRQPQAIGDLCLGCNSSLGKLTEPRLRELNLQDPIAVPGTFQTSATQL